MVAILNFQDGWQYLQPIWWFYSIPCHKKMSFDTKINCLPAIVLKIWLKVDLKNLRRWPFWIFKMADNIYNLTDGFIHFLVITNMGFDNKINCLLAIVLKIWPKIEFKNLRRRPFWILLKKYSSPRLILVEFFLDISGTHIKLLEPKNGCYTKCPGQCQFLLA